MKAQALYLELLWIGLAIAIAAALCIPPYAKFGPYAYALDIALNVFALVTLGRILLFSQRVFWLQPRYMKGVLTILCVPILLYAALTLNNVQNLVDAEGLDAMFAHASGEEVIPWGTYLRDMTVFACAGTFIAAVLLPITLIIRLWKQVKRQTRAEFSRKRSDVARG